MFKRLIGIMVLGLFLITSPCFAADTPGVCTQTLNGYGPTMQVLTFTCTGGSAGAYPSTATSTAITASIKGWYITEVRTNPGGTGPTNLYDIVLNDTDGIDIMGGTLADRSITASQRAIPALASGIYGGTAIDGVITLIITNNIVASAVTVIKVFLTR